MRFISVYYTVWPIMVINVLFLLFSTFFLETVCLCVRPYIARLSVKLVCILLGLCLLSPEKRLDQMKKYAGGMSAISSFFIITVVLMAPARTVIITHCS